MIIADTHVHLYPCYDLEAALRGLAGRLRALAPGAQAAAFLTERHDCHVFAGLRDGAIRLPDISVTPSAEAEAVRVSCAAGDLIVWAGRQLVTAERIEVLALTTDAVLADGMRARDALAAVREAGGVPVLPWGLGKWFLRRGDLVRELIETAAPGDLTVGDSAMRPRGWPEPGIMRMARTFGLPVLAGSDPLPLPGEERLMGTYATCFNHSLDTDRPVTSIRAILTTPGLSAAARGSRPGPLRNLIRNWRLARARVSHPKPFSDGV